MERREADEYIQRIVGEYSRMLLHVAYNVLRSADDAEDAVQETLVRLVTKRPQFRSAEHERAWLIRVTVNTAKNMRKRNARAAELTAGAEAISDDRAPSPEEETERGDLIRAVLALPPKYAAPLHLYYYEDMPIKEIARILRLPQGTVGTRLARARKMLRNMLEGDM